ASPIRGAIVIWRILSETLKASVARILSVVTISTMALSLMREIAPPDKTHTYVFKLYALDTELDLPQKSTKADVENAMEGHILEQTILEGTYAP
ncbi:MAG: hypothetical protein COB91_01135, partial [Nitrosopumilales archaeon]